MLNKTSDIITQLLEKLFNKDFKGYDPYDIKAHPVIRKFIKWGNQAYLLAIVRELILEFIYHFPQRSRSLFNIQPAHNSKALGLLGAVCIELSILNEFDNDLIHKTQNRIDKLLANYKTNTKGGIGWGYPFDWQSQQLIPSNTPNGIVTTAVGEYYWLRYKSSGDEDALDTCIKIARFLRSLPADYLSSDQLCFSYVPHYQNHIHNLNLFVADFLIKVGLEMGDKEWVKLGNYAVNYTIANQRSDGSFDYNGPPEKPQNFVDNYHTGFVLRMLGSCYHYTKRDDIKKALDKGLTYYLDHFFTEEGIPKFKPDRIYPIDIHSSAEAINCLIFLSDYNEKASSTVQKVLNWTLENLYDRSENDFYHAIMKSRFTGSIYRSEIKYIRWSQAWMLRALSRYILYTQKSRILI